MEISQDGLSSTRAIWWMSLARRELGIRSGLPGNMRDIFRKITCREYKKIPQSLVLWGSENIVSSYGYCDSSPLFIPFFVSEGEKNTRNTLYIGTFKNATTFPLKKW